jgi:hypothetical protein
MDLKHGGLSRPATSQNFPSANNQLEKFSPRLFGMDQNGILRTDYLPKCQTINTEYYSSLLVQLNDILKKKCHAVESHLSVEQMYK